MRVDPPSWEETRRAVHRALRVCRIVDPDDGTVPFFLVDGNLVWVRDKQAVDTIAHAVMALWTDGERGLSEDDEPCYGVTNDDATGDAT